MPSLLFLLDRRYTEGPVCKMNVAVFSSSSLLPYSLVCSWTAVGHTFVSAVCRSGHIGVFMEESNQRRRKNVHVFLCVVPASSSSSSCSSTPFLLSLLLPLPALPPALLPPLPALPPALLQSLFLPPPSVSPFLPPLHFLHYQISLQYVSHSMSFIKYAKKAESCCAYHTRGDHLSI